MKSYTLFQEYIWLINTIHKARKITLEEINSRWVETEMSGGLPMVRSTFNRHKDAIQEMFGIYIECDRRDGFRYYIGNDEVLSENTIQNWMLSTLSVNSILNDSRSIHDRILLEAIPSSGETLSRIIEAMKTSVRVRLRYHRYGADKEGNMTVDPYCIKLFDKRWYVLVKFPATDGMFILALDRITSLELTKKKFTYNKDFDPQTHFKECFGIVNDQSVPLQKVVIRAFDKEVFYLRDLPLHHSQTEIITEDGYSDFEYMLRPTTDFYPAVLAKGSAVKVLEPKQIADEIRSLHEQALKIYND